MNASLEFAADLRDTRFEIEKSASCDNILNFLIRTSVARPLANLVDQIMASNADSNVRRNFQTTPDAVAHPEIRHEVAIAASHPKRAIHHDSHREIILLVVTSHLYVF